MSYSYNTRNLVVDFLQLKALDHSDLCSILDEAFNEWLKQIPNNAVSDIQKLQERHGFYDKDNSYICVIDSKIVNLNVSGYNVSEDEDERYYKAENISFSTFEWAEKEGKIKKTTPVVVYCLHGIRSHRILKFLQAKGYKKVCHLQGGFEAYQSA